MTDPHPNDMTHWDEIRCQRGCESHPTRKVQIHLGGPTKYRDLTSIPARFEMDFEIEVWDTDQTPVDGGPYCPARDAVSETIISHGVWEPRETVVILLALEALGRGAGRVFLDVGSQIGWFSTVAFLADAHVVAFEADLDVAAVCNRNLRTVWGPWGVAGPSQEVVNSRISGDPLELDHPWIPGENAQYVVKIDIEGAEAQAIAGLDRQIEEGRVPFILMEVSPVFNDSYPDLVVDLIDRGYAAYLMPPKHIPPVQIETLADLRRWRIDEYLMEWGSRVEIRDLVRSWHQEDVLFVKGGVEAWS